MNIDFVITWLDSSDERWINKRNDFAPNNEQLKMYNECRFRDWETLKFWFRAVENNAPWVNNIFLSLDTSAN